MNRLLRLGILALCFLLTGAGRLEFSRYQGMDYLQILGLERNFSDSDLKRAFRRAMMKYHPDQGGLKAASQFVNEANEVLKDAQTRELFYLWLDGQTPPPQMSEDELRRENILRTVQEVFAAAVRRLNEQPTPSKQQMAVIARTVILYYARYFKGQTAGVAELAEMMNEHVLGTRSGASYSPRLVLAMGLIELLKMRAPRGYEEGAEAKEYLERLGAQLESDIRAGGDPHHREFLDRVFESLTGRSILREPPRPKVEPGVSVCEAILRYEQAAGLSVEIPIRVDIRF